MSDTLHNWMVKYIQGIKGGFTHEYLLDFCAIDQQTFDDAKRDNEAFKNALSLAEAGIGATEINAPDLLRMLRAQVSDARIAGFFCLTLEELKSKLLASAEFERIYRTGRLRGQAELQMTQHVVALTGDVPMLTFLGKQYLEQQDKSTVELTSSKLDEMIRQLESQLGQSAVTKAIAAPVLEGEFEEVEESDAAKN